MIQTALDFSELMRHVALKLFDILLGIAIGILSFAFKHIVCDEVCLPQLVIADNPLVKSFAQCLIAVIFIKDRCFMHLFRGYRLINTQIDSAFPLAYAAYDAVGILMLFLDVFLLSGDEKFPCLTDIT